MQGWGLETKIEVLCLNLGITACILFFKYF